jgi:hypothetical protein
MAKENRGKNNGNKISRFAPSGNAPAFDRVVAPVGAALYGTRERVPFHLVRMDGHRGRLGVELP